MARYHLSTMLPRADTAIVAVCEPSPATWAAQRAGLPGGGPRPIPPNEPDWRRFLDRFGPELDAVMIITPHALHHDQATAALEAGLDVYLEKPMVMTAAEAESLIATRDRTGRLLVVGFQGSLSPRVRAASRLIASGEVGALLNVDALVWQDWASHTPGTWRQDPVLSGGGFLFDTGAHLLNTVCDLAGQDVTEVAAWLEDDARTGRPARRGHGPPGRRRPGHDERLRSGHPVARLGHPGVLRAGDPAHRGVGRAPGDPAPRRGPGDEPALRPRPHRLGAVRRRPRRAASRTPRRPRSGCAWPGCGTPSARRPSAAASVVRPVVGTEVAA